MKLSNQQGSSHIVVVLAVLVLVGVGAAGYRVMHTSDSTAPDVISSKNSEPASIKSAADVKRASAALNDTSIDGKVNPAQLDKDLNSLL